MVTLTPEQDQANLDVVRRLIGLPQMSAMPVPAEDGGIMLQPPRGITPPLRASVRRISGFIPTGTEQLDILDTTGNRIIVVGGEQAGKSYVGAQFLVERILEDGKGLYWLGGSKYSNTEREFEYALNTLTALGYVASKGTTTYSPERPSQITLKDGTIIRTISAHDSQNITKFAPKGVLVCEASQISLESYKKFYARAVAGHGWLFMSGTVERAEPWFPGVFRQYKSGIGGQRAYNLPSWTNRFIYPGGEFDPLMQEMRAEFDVAFFEERFAAKIRPPAGLVFSNDFSVDFHVRDESDLHYMAGYPGQIAIDYGTRAAYAVLFIQVLRVPPDFDQEVVCVMDEIYVTNTMTEAVCDLTMGKMWWKDVEHAVIDAAARDPHQAVTPPVQVWREKTTLSPTSRRVSVMDGIDRLRNFFAPFPHTLAPRLLISTKCAGLLSELGARPSPLTGRMQTYKWKTDEAGDIQGKAPMDQYNHSIKALTYWLIDRYGFVKTQREKVTRLRRHRRTRRW